MFVKSTHINQEDKAHSKHLKWTIDILLITWEIWSCPTEVISNMTKYQMSNMFCNILVKFTSPRCFCQSHEGDTSHMSVRWEACLMPSKAYLLNFSLWHGV